MFVSKGPKAFEFLKILFLEHKYCVTYQITIKFYEQLKFESIFLKKLILGSKNAIFKKFFENFEICGFFQMQNLSKFFFSWSNLEILDVFCPKQEVDS